MTRVPFSRSIVLSAILVAVGCTPSAQAQSTYGYEWAREDGTQVSGSLTLAGGETVTLRVYLREQGGTTLANEGLFSGGVRASYFDPLVPGSSDGVIAVPGVAAISQNPAFDGQFTEQVRPPNFAQFVVLNGFTSPPITAADGRVWLGSFTFQASNTSGGSTVLTALDIPVSSDPLTAMNGMILDADIAPASLTVTVAPVPEPGAVFAVGLLGLVLGRQSPAARG